MLNDFISLFYPRNCIACNTALSRSEKHCCLACLAELPLTNYAKFSDNPIAKLFWGRIELTFGFSIYHFTKGGAIQAMMHELKYKGRTEIGEFLGIEIGKILTSSNLIDQIDLIIPVPLHPKKERLRGYNQSEYIVRGIHHITKIEMSDDCLKRTINTKSQTRKSKYDRWENVAEIFEVNQPKLISNKRILLVDDVITTGSTLESCAKTLLNQGATSVGIAVVASGN